MAFQKDFLSGSSVLEEGWLLEPGARTLFQEGRRGDLGGKVKMKIILKNP